MITLAIEASTYVGSVALFDDGRLVQERTVAMRGREHEALMPAVADALHAAGIAPSGLGRIVCGAGPGAFTSLRIAGGIAKGLALAWDIPLVPVSSLALLAASRTLSPRTYLAAVDAMRGEHYVQPYEVGADGTVVASGGVRLTSSLDVAAAAESLGAIAIGPAQGGDRSIDPHARGVARLRDLIARTPAADLPSWEPAYGRLAEAQVKWEAAHGQPLAVG